MTTLQSLLVDDKLLTAIDVDLPDSLTSLYISGNAITSREPLATHALQCLTISSNPLVSLAPLFDLPALISVTASDVGASDLTEFPLAQLRGLVADNPLDAAGHERLTWLCSQGGASYRWDGGECDKCPRR